MVTQSSIHCSQGPNETHRCAIFDADGTLLRFHSMSSFEKFWLNEALEQGDLGPSELEVKLDSLARLRFYPRATANRQFYSEWGGRSVRAVQEAVSRWHVAEVGNYCEQPLAALAMLVSQGIPPVLISGAAQVILAPFAKDIGINTVITTQLGVRDGHYTGAIIGHPMIGATKAVALNEVAASRGFNLEASFAFGDHITDLPMLERVGHPHVVQGDELLETIARENGWPILSTRNAPKFGEIS